MKYKGYTIEPVYFVGSTFKVLSDGRVVSRKPTKVDIEYYDIYEPDNDSQRIGVGLTVEECKALIRKERSCND